MKHAAAAAIVALAAATAHADEVVLRNGARFEGQVKESGDTVTVTLEFGTITFRKIDVAKIDRGPSPLAEFDARVVELKADDLDGKYRLAMWARTKDLHQRAGHLLEDILARNPNHAGAREALGYRRVGDRWLTEEQEKAEQGLVRFRGEWMKHETADAIRRIEAERATELARIAAEEAARIRILQAEAEELRKREEAARAWEESQRDRWHFEQPLVPFIPWHRPCPVPRFQKPIHLGNAVFFPAGTRACADVRDSKPAATTPKSLPRPGKRN